MMYQQIANVTRKVALILNFFWNKINECVSVNINCGVVIILWRFPLFTWPISRHYSTDFGCVHNIFTLEY